MTDLPPESAVDDLGELPGTYDPFGAARPLMEAMSGADEATIRKEAAELGLPSHVVDQLVAKAAEGGFSPTEPFIRRPREPFESAVSFVHMAARDETRRRELIAYPQALFRGRGLWLWGTDETTLVHSIRVGNQNCFSLSHVAIPGLYFEAGLAFDDFEELLDSPLDDWSHARLKSLPALPKHQRIRMLTAEIGNTVLLDVEGPISHAVMWGATIH